MAALVSSNQLELYKLACVGLFDRTLHKSYTAKELVGCGRAWQLALCSCALKRLWRRARYRERTKHKRRPGLGPGVVSGRSYMPLLNAVLRAQLTVLLPLSPASDRCYPVSSQLFEIAGLEGPNFTHLCVTHTTCCTHVKVSGLHIPWQHMESGHLVLSSQNPTLDIQPLHS